MSKEIDILISYNVQSLDEVTVYDATACTYPDRVADIKGIRMLFSTVNSVAAVQTAVITLEAWREYVVVSGAPIVNGITYAVDDRLLFANEESPSGTFVIDETGRYAQYISDTLPGAGLPYVFTPTQTGRVAVDSIYFQDEVFILDYEQYETVYSYGDTLAAGTYLCVGIAGASIVIGSAKTVYVGETYTSLGSETFVGASDLILYSAESQFFFATKGQSFVVYEAYLRAKAVAVNPNEDIDSGLLTVASLYASVDIAAQQTSGIGLDQMQINLNRIIEYYSVQPCLNV